MKNMLHKKLTLDERVRYEVVVSGRMERCSLNWGAAVRIAPSCDKSCEATVISGFFDQAALHGLLRSTYSRGFPLVSVKLIEGPADDSLQPT